MKKYFIKIVVILLLAIALPMTSELCLQAFSTPLFKINMTSVAIEEIRSMAPMPFSKNHNSPLPCCVDGDQPNAVISTQNIETEKPLPILSFNIDTSLIVPLEKNIYHPPIISPPKLLALKTIILRL